MKNRLEGKTALITGATAGIGKSIAHQLAAMKVNLIITGRRAERLETEASELKEKFGVDVQIGVFDVREKDEISSFFSITSIESIDILVNNAGLALGVDPVDQADFEDWDGMIDTNIKGLIYMTRIVSASMKKRGTGHILNICSTAGHEFYPGGSVYTATKHAVKAFTRSAKMDLHGTGVRVSLLSPGLVETEFSNVRFKGDDNKADSVYQGMTPLYADDIAEIAVFTLNRPDSVNILDTIVVPTDQSSSTMVYRRDES